MNDMKNTRKQLGIRLFNLALAWSHDMPETQRERNAAIKSMRARKSIINGSKSITAAREAVESAANNMINIRNSRHQYKQMTREYYRRCSMFGLSIADVKSMQNTKIEIDGYIVHPYFTETNMEYAVRFSISEIEGFAFYAGGFCEKDEHGESKRDGQVKIGRVSLEDHLMRSDEFKAYESKAKTLRKRISKTQGAFTKTSSSDRMARLSESKRMKVMHAFRDTLRQPTHGDVNVNLTSSPDSVDVTVEHTLDWDIYRGSFKGRPANVYSISVTVPEQWAPRVLKTGLATADGMLTLDAAPLDGAPEGIRLYAATWAQQARGYEIRVNHGIIATDGVRFHHADTVKKALTGLRRKAAYVPPTAEQSIDRFCAKYARESFQVCLDDAREVGACEYGIRSWCDANNIDMSRRCIPASEAVAAYRNRPQPEARAAILYARRHALASA